MSQIEELRAAVEANGDAVASAVNLITTLAARIREANESEDAETAVSVLADELETQASALGSAVLANTPGDGSKTAPDGTSSGNGPGTPPANPS